MLKYCTEIERIKMFSTVVICVTFTEGREYKYIGANEFEANEETLLFKIEYFYLARAHYIDQNCDSEDISLLLRP